MIEDAGAGLVCAAGRRPALAQRVGQLMQVRADARSAMGAAGRAYCQREFDRAHLISALETWIEELITAQRVAEDSLSS